MQNLTRLFLGFALATFISAGTALAQMPAHGQPANASTSKGNSGKKCGQTPKGCHKNQPQPNPNRKCGQTPQGCHKNQPNGNPQKPPA